MLDTFCNAVFVRSLAVESRIKALSLFQMLVAKYGQLALDTRNTDLLETAITSLDGERDPRCLLGALHVMGAVIQLYHRQPLDTLASARIEEGSEEAFDVLSCYFPIEFKPPPNDPHKISREELATALCHSLTCTPIFVEYVVPFMLEKLSSNLLQAKLDVFDVIAALAQWKDEMGSHLPALWAGLEKEVFYSTREGLLAMEHAQAEEIAHQAAECVGKCIEAGCTPLIDFILQDEMMQDHEKIMVSIEGSTHAAFERGIAHIKASVIVLCAVLQGAEDPRYTSQILSFPLDVLQRSGNDEQKALCWCFLSTLLKPCAKYTMSAATVQRIFEAIVSAHPWSTNPSSAAACTTWSTDRTEYTATLAVVCSLCALKALSVHLNASQVVQSVHMLLPRLTDSQPHEGVIEALSALLSCPGADDTLRCEAIDVILSADASSALLSIASESRSISTLLIKRLACLALDYLEEGNVPFIECLTDILKLEYNNRQNAAADVECCADAARALSLTLYTYMCRTHHPHDNSSTRISQKSCCECMYHARLLGIGSSPMTGDVMLDSAMQDGTVSLGKAVIFLTAASDCLQGIDYEEQRKILQEYLPLLVAAAENRSGVDTANVYALAAASIVNKLSSSDLIADALKGITDDNAHLLVLVTRALAMTSHNDPVLDELVGRIVALNTDEYTVLLGANSLEGHKDIYLPFAVTRILWQQRLYTKIMNALLTVDSGGLNSADQAAAIAGIIDAAPSKAVSQDAHRILPLISDALQVLYDNKRGDKLLPILRFITNTLEQRSTHDHFSLEHIACLVPHIINCTSFPSKAAVREAALRTLICVSKLLPYTRLHTHRNSAIRATTLLLDDTKRAVRVAAATCRHVWTSDADM